MCLCYNLIVFMSQTQLRRKVFMKYTILTENIVNPITGEILTKDFKEIVPKSQLKRGFTMIYKIYDDALLSVVKSRKDVAIFLHIRDLFSRTKIETKLNSREIAKKVGSKLKEKLTPSKVTEVKNRMIESDLIMRVDRGVYRLNPFAYLPVFSDGTLLQKEWRELNER